MLRKKLDEGAIRRIVQMYCRGSITLRETYEQVKDELNMASFDPSPETISRFILKYRQDAD